MLAPLLMYGLPAALGGIEGYRRSGGNLGAAALGAGLSAAIPGGLRMAGTALGGLGAGALAKTPLGGLLAAQTAKTGSSLLTQLPKAAGYTAATLGGLVAAPSIAGSIASGAAGAINAAGGGLLSAGGAMGIPGLGAGPVPRAGVDGNPLPPGLDPTYGYQPWGTYTQAVNPLSEFNAGRLMSEKEADTQSRNTNLMLGTIKPWADATKKEDLARNLYAMTVKNNQLTQSNALLGGLDAARRMGATLAQQAGAAVTNQYQYV